MKSIAASGAVLSLLLLNACATRPESVQAKPISQSKYEGHACADLREAFTDLRADETRLSDEMSSTANGQLGMNVLGGVLMATTGIGFARTTNNQGHAHALAEVRGHLVAIRDQANSTSCVLPEETAAAR
ncbi:MAG: hypothetical protein IV088_21670 [Hydrogenophaga sp.]|uniref:hypothetical protein n=1 Tax=Hydrogenophaga sp. TaxID=1904254 RepID=UPI0025BC929B|nr:hypothetical protein [Hydrogenophaga sp.]MBT9553460.1 hypothetical protein [Hydrogenophaga sp.]